MTAAFGWPSFRQELLDFAAERKLAEVLAHVTASVAEAMDVECPDLVALFGTSADPGQASGHLNIPATVAEPDLLGRVHELLRDPDRRHTDGAYYTPPAVADGLVAIVLETQAGRDSYDRQQGDRPDGGRSESTFPTVCDPAVGGGVFLLAAARSLHGSGLSPDEIVARHLWGLDIDPLAVATTRAALSLWSASAGRHPKAPTVTDNGHASKTQRVSRRPCLVPDDHLSVGDFLADPVAGWAPPSEGFGAVVGNPPFQAQLSRTTARTSDSIARMRSWLGDAVHGYTDTAALFLVAGCMRTRTGGRVALILPEPILGSSHAEGARRAVGRRAALQGLWLPGGRLFAANVRVCAPVVEVGAPASTALKRWTGISVVRVGDMAVPAVEPGANEWAVIAARASGVPAVDVVPDGRPTLSSMADATAGFRDQFYGLAAHVREEGPEHEGWPRLVTVGAIDPGVCRWGEVDVRFARTPWRRPVVDVSGLAADDPVLAAWLRSRLVPKALVATQTKVVEAVADPEGELVPSVPVIAVTPRQTDRLWHLMAVLLAPPVTAWAAQRTWGTGLGAGTMRLSARLLLDVPLPVDLAAWDEGAETAAAVHRSPDATGLDALGRVMTAAYGLDASGPVLGWWRSRRRGVRRA